MTPEDLRILKSVEALADEVWQLAGNFDRSSREIVGSQLIRATDSSGANIAEGYGRFHYGERLMFLYHARGSLFETQYWRNRCCTRQLIPAEACSRLAQQLGVLARELNGFVRFVRNRKENKSDGKGTSRITESPSAYVAGDSATGPDFISAAELAYLLE